MSTTDQPTIKAEALPQAGLGQTLGRYRLLEKIGEGGFGVVYVAEQKEPVKRRVALKIVLLEPVSVRVVRDCSCRPVNAKKQPSKQSNHLRTAGIEIIRNLWLYWDAQPCYMARCAVGPQFIHPFQ